MAQAIIIDCEHGHISDDSMHTATAAIAAQGVSPIVRIRMTHPDLIKRALDTGAQYVNHMIHGQCPGPKKVFIVVLSFHRSTQLRKSALLSLMRNFPRKDFEDRAHPFPGSLMILISPHT